MELGRGVPAQDPTAGDHVSRSLVHVLRERSLERPDVRLYTFLGPDGGETATLTYGELDLRARAVAARLESLGAAGERALLLFPPGLEFVAGFLGCLYAGVAAVPAYPPRPRREESRLRSLLQDAEARFVLCQDAIRDRVEQLAETVAPLREASRLSVDRVPDELALRWSGCLPDPERPAFLQYTSGSTAEPKGVVVSHANLAHNEEKIRRAFGQSESSVVVGWLPFYHDMGLIGNLLQPLWSGARAVLMSPLSFLQRPVRWLEAISRYRGTTSGGPNFAYDLCSRRIDASQREELDLSSWTVAFNGAEPVRAETLDRFARAFAVSGFRKEAFYPCYGLAEATLFVSGGSVAEGPVTRRVSRRELERNRAVDAPAEDPGAAVVVSSGAAEGRDGVVVAHPERRRRLPAGRVGEIWVSGPSVASGYWRRPEATEELFQARTVSGEGPFLRTGDLGFLEGDRLYVTGRLKDLIILRGRNHYPQDFERTAESSHQALRPGCGAAFSVERDAEERLILVHEVGRSRRSEAELREIAETVRRRVADEHQVAVEEVVLVRQGGVPKTSSGKVRRGACRESYRAGELEVLARSVSEPLRAEPADEVAGSLLEDLWRRPVPERRRAVAGFLAAELPSILRVAPESLEPGAPLAALGLDSLAAVELKNRLDAATGTALPLARLLEGASAAEIAAWVAESVPEGEDAAPAPVPWVSGPAGGPASRGQRALWLLERMSPEAGVLNLTAAAVTEEELKPAPFRHALARLAGRHEALRTTFSAPGGELGRRVHPRLDPELRTGGSVPAARVEGLFARESTRPFDLERGPLLRARLLPVVEGGTALYLGVHHLVCDFWSAGILLRELAALYAEESGGPGVELPKPALGYGDYVRWQEHLLAGELGEAARRHWRRDAGEGGEPLRLPTDRPRPPVRSRGGSVTSRRLAESLSARLRTSARDRETTVHNLLLAAFQALLHRYGGQEVVEVAVPASGRGVRELEGLVGYLVNPLPLRAELPAGLSFGDLVHQVSGRVAVALEHQDLPSPLADRGAGPEARSLEAGFRAMFVLYRVRRSEDGALAAFALGEAGGAVDLGGLRLEPLRLPPARVQCDATLAVADLEDRGFLLSLQLDRDLFDAVTGRRMMAHLLSVLDHGLAAPGRRVDELPLLTAPERKQMLGEWQGATARPASDLLHSSFERHAAECPDAVALVTDGFRSSYGELARRASRLAARLRSAGLGPGERAAVLLDRGPHLVVSLLAVLRTGAAYVPIDPAYPRERKDWILRDAGVRLVVTEETRGDRMESAGCPVVPIRDDGSPVVPLAASPAAGPPDLPPRAGDPRSLAYVIYTSGSTGRPKGVAIEHRSAVALLDWARRRLGPAAFDGMLAATSVCFDLSVFELFGPLSTGGKIVLAPDALSLPRLATACEVRTVNTVPSAAAELVRSHGFPPSVTTVCLAGEPLRRNLVDALYEETPAGEVLNLYGPSEDTTYSTSARVPRGDADAPTIGRPVDGTRLYLADARLRLLPTLVPGELVLGGSGLARGYLARPSLTAQRFVPDPWGGEAGGRLYRTGDLARHRRDGEVDFLGRLDHQVKVRGHRIELGEVEAALAGHPAVREAVVVATGADADPGREGAGERRLVAYLVPWPGREPESGSVRDALLHKLPEPMVPSIFVTLDDLPRTPNGKVDRARLPAPDLRTRAATRGLPRTPAEALVAGAWREAFELDEVGVGDSFLALGGHSLLAARIQARIRERSGVELPLRAFFESPTVELLAARIAPLLEETTGRAPRSSSGPWPRTSAERAEAPLSPAQERLWMLHRLDPGSPAYHVAGVADLSGPLALPALHRSLRTLVERQEVLRTRYPEEVGAPRAVVGGVPARLLGVVDLGRLRPGAREREARAVTRREARRPFDLSTGPVLRLRLLRLGPEHHRLAVTLHHVAADESSLEVFVHELTDLYGRAAGAAGPPLPRLPLHHADVASWQRERLAHGELEDLFAWWSDHLRDLEPLDLPADRPRPPVRSDRGGLARRSLPRHVVSRVEALGRSEGASAFMIWLAAFQAVLHRYCGYRSLPVGTPVSIRDDVRLEGLVGFLVNTLVLRLDGSAELSFRELLGRARRELLAAQERAALPFESLVERLSPRRGLDRNPLFDVLFALHRPPRGGEAAGLRIEPVSVPTDTAKLDLSLFVVEPAPGRFDLELEYAADLFDPSTARRILGHVETLIGAAVEAPERPVSVLPLLTPAERHAVLREWCARDGERSAGPGAAEGGRSLAERFARRAASCPDRIAVVHGHDQVSYGELGRRVEGLAGRLRDLDVRPEEPVAVFSDRSPDLVASLLATLWSGAAYVPLDPAYPRNRIDFLLRDSGARVVWSAAALVPDLPPFDGAVLPLGADGETAGDRSPLPAPADPEGVAYVIYTSGSTGTPKGVAVRHGGLSARVDWAAGAVAAGDLQGVLAATSVCFDLSVFEILVPLALGGTVIVADDALALPGIPGASRVRLVNTVPSALAELLEVGGVPPSVRTVNLAGEPLRRDLVDRAQALPGVAAVFNLYGPSEDTTYSTAALVSGSRGGKPSIGRALPATRVHLLDPVLEPVPVGVPGGLWIAGRGLARGYLGRPGRTAERFLPNPLGETPGARLYRTGDLARFRTDGELDFLGRVDTQVKVRGFRIELGEVETALERHPAVREAAVEARSVAGDPVLVAYVAADPEVPAGDLASHLRRQLPSYMVPSLWIALPELPRTPNGKLDRRALPDPEPDAGPGAGVPPRTPVEVRLQAIWAEVLGRDLGVHDDFFAHGGHSLSAVRVVARLREPLDVELPLRALFEAPTIAALALRVEEARQEGATGAPVPPLVRRDRDDDPPLSFGQERLWFLDRLEPGSPVYNLPAALRLRGALDEEALRRSIRRIVDRHASLRTTFAVRGGSAVQVVSSPGPVPVPVIDLGVTDARSREAAARAAIRREALQPFDLSAGPLLRTRLLRLGPRDHVLVLTVHHIACDGWSLGILLRELAAFYAAETAGGPTELPPLPVQYGDFAAWQRSWLQGAVLEGSLRYWRERLAGAAPVLDLPTDRPRPSVQSYRGGSRRLEVDPALVAPLRAVGGAAGATLFMTLLAAFATVLHRYTGRADMVLGTPTANRSRVEVEPLVGLFANSLVLRLDAGEDPSFVAFLGRVRDATVEAFGHQDVPFEKLVEELRPQRDLSHNPIYQTVFALEEGVRPELDLPGLEATPVEVESGTAKFDLALYMEERRGRLSGLLEYNRDLFDESTGLRFVRHFRTLLGEVARDPRSRLSELSLLSATERHQVLVEENDTGRPGAPGAFFHHRFAHRAVIAPDAPAVSRGDEVLTYGEVFRRSRALAVRLRALGVGTDRPVAVCMERSPDLVVAMLGILQAGAAYLPLDPAYPEDRLAFMLGDSGARALLTQEHLRAGLPASGARVVTLEDGSAPSSEDGLDDLEVGPDHLAYVIYTSGSTGRPKGTMIRHASLASYLDTAVAAYGVEAGDRVLQFCSISFDISLEEIVPCLSVGAELVFRTDAMMSSIAHFLETCGGRRLTLMSLPTAFWHEITARLESDGLEVPPSLRMLIIAGERALPERLGAWLDKAPERPRLINTYGLTESTIISTVGDLTAGGPPPPGREVPIGRTIADTQLHVLDRRLAPVPLGISGELFIGGDLLARGYLGRFRTTAERFVPDLFARLPGARLYRTGDLARRLADGQLEFLGRGDHQVKVRGYRIELGEIEAALVRHREVDGAAVTTVEERPGDKRLVAYLTGRNGQAPSVASLRSFLGETLPDYMVPGLFVVLEELPLTPNGKVDRDALPAPDGQRLASGSGFVAPGNDAETAMAEIWSEVLGLERVGIHDNFFDLGGHSLLLVRLHERIGERFGTEVSLVDLFRHPTVHALARFLEGAGGGEATSLDRVRDRAGSARSHAVVYRRRFQEARRRVHD